MSTSPLSRLLSVTSWCLAASLAGAIPAAFLDVGRALAHAETGVTAPSLARALAASLALFGVAGIVLGSVVGVVLGSVAAALPENFWSRARQRLQDDEAADTSTAAALFSAGAATVLLAIVVYAYARGFGLEMASKRNGALSTAMVAAATMPLAILGAFPAYLALRPLARVLPRPRALMAAALMASVAALTIIGAVLSVDWRVIDFGPFSAFGIFASLAAAHSLVWSRPPFATWWARQSSLVHRLALAGPTAIALLLLAATISGLEHDARALALVGEETSGARMLLRVARRLADRDHDGYAAVLGGGDCNDHDPTVHPGAEDIPGNGIDEDCSDGDALVENQAEEDPSALAAKPDAEVHAPGNPSPPAGDRPANSGALPQPGATPPGIGAAHADAPVFDGNLLIITIDTMRADRLNPKTTPHLAALAHDSVVFTHAYAQAPNTPRSFPSFLTSRYASQVRFTRGFANFSPLAPENLTFFEVLKQAGFHTVGEFSHFYLDAHFGTGQGFDEWNNEGALTLHDSNTDVAAPRVAAKVVKKLRELGKSKQKFALWTHFFDPHSRYMDHAEFPVHGNGMSSLGAKYDGEVSFVDLHVQKILDALKAAGLDGNTAVVVFSDHGEGFGEHRFGGEQMFFHGQTLYNELLRVPFVVHVPGVAARTVDEQVMLLDLGPTLLELVGARVPPSFQGRSLAPALHGAVLAPRPVFAELLPEPSWNHSWRVVVDGPLKLIYKISENSMELYDVAKDPEEKHNLAFEDAGDVKRLKQTIQKWMQGAPHG